MSKKRLDWLLGRADWLLSKTRLGWLLSRTRLGWLLSKTRLGRTDWLRRSMTDGLSTRMSTQRNGRMARRMLKGFCHCYYN